MVEVAAFTAWEYNPAKVAIADVVSPPNDVIGDRDLLRLRKASPYNIVHATKPVDVKGKKKINPWKEADRLVEAWRAEEILQPTSDEVIYAYECAYTHHEAPKRMRGVVVRLKLDATYKSVVPHEEVFAKFADQRAEILRATGVDLEPIHLLYSGRNAEETLWAYVDGSQRKADLEATGLDGAIHRFWRINDSAVIATLVDAFKGRKAYIADGHHRYAAALRYAEERRAREYRPSKSAPWEYKLSLLVHMSDPGLLILPTHRIVQKAPAKTKGQDAASVFARWAVHFDVRPVPLSAGNPVTQLGRLVEAAGPAPRVAAWLGDPKQGFLLESRVPVVPEELVPGKSQTWRTLGVVFLQRLALQEGFQIPENRFVHDLWYTRDDGDALEYMKKQHARAVLLHQPTQLNQMRAIAEAGEKMPQKSTYFLPKILSGVMMYPIGKPIGEPSKPRLTS